MMHEYINVTLTLEPLGNLSDVKPQDGVHVDPTLQCLYFLSQQSIIWYIYIYVDYTASFKLCNLNLYQTHIITRVTNYMDTS